MTTYQLLSLFGVPSLCVGLSGVLIAMVRTTIAQTQAVKMGTQALLRAQMINDYNKWSERGYAPIYARENFLNCWKQYHSLGANGVMDDIKSKFLALPTPTKEVLDND